MYVNNVCKTYTNYSKKRNNNTKKSRYKLYFYSEDGQFHSKRISKVKVKYFRCENCNEKYRSIHGHAPCPFCDNT